MGRRTLKWWGLFCAAAAVLGTGLAVAALRSTDIRGLQVCTHTKRQPVAWACRQGLYRLHPTAAEVVELNAIAGSTFPLRLEDETEARQLLRHYLDKGIDVNRPDLRHEVQWTALHYAVAECSPRNVRLLLEVEARTDVRDGKGRTPLDLATELRAKRSRACLSDIVQQLEPEIR